MAITGSNGYIGNFLTKYLTEKGNSVLGIDLSSHQRQRSYKNFTFIKSDIRENNIKDIFKEHKVTHVIHTAFIMQPQHNKKRETNVDVYGSKNIFLAASQTRSVKQFINISSTSIYGGFKDNPLWIKEEHPLRPRDWLYAQNKKKVEEFIFSKKVKMNIVNLRLCTVVGPNYYKKGGVVAIISKGSIGINLNSKPSIVQFCHENDIKQIMEFILNDNNINGIFNIAPDSFATVNDLNQKKIYFPFPKFLFRIIIASLWSLRLSQISPTSVNLIAHGIVASPKKIEDYFGYKFLCSTEEAYHITVNERLKNKTI